MMKIPSRTSSNKLPSFQPTVIVPEQVQYEKVKWNEFQEEEQKEKESVPRVKAQDWVPENDPEHPVVKTTYQPGRINAQWPPGPQEEEEKPLE